MSKGFNRPMSPGSGGMLGQLRKMQEQLAEAQAKLAEETVTATVGGGVVKITMTGDQHCKNVEIDPEIGPLAFNTREMNLGTAVIIKNYAHDILGRHGQVAVVTENKMDIPHIGIHHRPESEIRAELMAVPGEPAFCYLQGV